MEVVRRKELPIIITTVSFLITFLPYFFNLPAVDVVAKYTVDWALMVSYFMAIVGLIHLTRYNVTSIQKRRRGWPYGLITLILLYYMIIAGFAYGTTDIKFNFFYNAIALSLTALVSGLLGFYFFSAGGRAFRARDFRATVLLIAAFLMLMKNAPVGLLIWKGFSPVGSYVMDVLVASGNRAFKIGTAVAGIALGIRVLIGQETSQIGLVEEAG